MRKFYFKALIVNALLILGLMFMFVTNIAAQVSGTVFRDFNGDGVLQTPTTAYEEPGLGSVTVKAFDNTNNLLATTTTNSIGAYSFSNLTFPVRIEFSDLPTGFYASKSGSSNGSSIQFYNAATSSANFAVNLPSEYSLLATDKIIGIQMDKNASTLNAIFTVPYGNTGNTYAGRINLNSPIASGSGVKTGALWGAAYQSSTDRVFTSAFMRRFAAFGTGGTGAIYVTSNAKNNPNSSATTQFINLNGMIVSNAAGGTTTVNTGSDPHYYTNLLQDIDNANGSPFDAVGKISFGDMDISDDKEYLYVVSLNDRKLYRIEIDADNNINTNPSAVDVLAYDIPTGGCTNGIARPFGLGIRNNEVYLGVTCDASSTGNILPTADQTVTVYKLIGSSFTSIISFPMDYYRGTVTGEFGTTNDHKFRPWVSTWTSTFPYPPYIDGGGGALYAYPQPMLSDILFDVDGSMILGIGDRFSYQAANLIPNANNSQSKLIDARGGGDILRVCNTGTLQNPTYTLEGGSSCPTSSAAGITYANGQPTEQEFYVGDYFHAGHSEIAYGGLTMSYGSKRVISTTLDPVLGGNTYRSGFKYLSNVNGGDLNGYEINSNFDKCSGIGDIEMLGSIAPVEIGNRVFMDSDSDGEQDAGEMGLDGIKVELWKNGVKITETTTANDGQWYFSNVDANTDFEIKILTASFPSGKTLTVKDAQTNSKDLIDNDATLVNSDAIIVYRTGNPGQNDHSLDFGFKEACNLSTSASGTNVTCNGGTDGTASVVPTGNVSAVTYLWSNGANTSTISNLIAGNYSVTVLESASCTSISSVIITEPSDITLTCTKNDVTISGGNDGTASVAASGGTAPYTYLWSTGATTSSIASLIAGTYTVTVSDANGCSDICTSQITEPSCNLATIPSGTPVTCHSGTDGAASVTTTGNVGALSYLWSTGGTTSSITGLVVGTYSVTVTETAVCKSVSTVTITEPTAMSVTCTKTNVTTNGGNDGTASVAASGGTAPYTYLWSNGETTSSIADLTAGIYTVTVSDANGCSDVCTSQITEPNCTPPNVGANQTLTCNANQAPTTSTLIAAPNGYTWNVLSQPNGASVTINNSGAVSNMTKSGNYVFELIKDTDSSCKSSIQIIVPSCTIPCPTVNCGTMSIRKL